MKNYIINFGLISITILFLSRCNTSSTYSEENFEKLNSTIDSLSNVIDSNSINLKKLLSSNIIITRGEYVRSDGYDGDWWHEFIIKKRNKTIYSLVDGTYDPFSEKFNYPGFEILNNIPQIGKNEWPESDENGDCSGSCSGTIVYINLKYETFNQATYKNQMTSSPFLIYFMPD